MGYGGASVSDPAVAARVTALEAAPLNVNRLLWSLTSANMNTTADQALTKAFTFTNYVIDRIVVTNASTSLTLAAGGFYTGTSKGGVTIVSAAQVYSGLTSSSIIVNPTLASTALRTEAALYLALTIAQGGAATADVRVFGWALT